MTNPIVENEKIALWAVFSMALVLQFTVTAREPKPSQAPFTC